MAINRPPLPVVVVIGTGGMGLASARRVANGRRLMLADYSQASLESVGTLLRNEGHQVETYQMDVSKLEDVVGFANAAAAMGRIEVLVHTAGLGANQADRQRVLDVDLVGTANVIEAFYELVAPGSSTVCIASLAGHIIGLTGEGAASPLSPALERHLAAAPVAELLQHPEISACPDAYALAKRGNILRVKNAAVKWGHRGARLNSISPGCVSTAMLHSEREGKLAARIEQSIGLSALGRVGTPDDISHAVAFLVGPESSFITGTDLLLDGGSAAFLSSQTWA